MAQSRKVAVLGGSFDPVHVDHIQMAKECLRFNYVDEVWFFPGPDQRWDKRLSTPLKWRVEMLELAIAPYKSMKIDLLEAHREEYRGSYFLLKELTERHPEKQFSLVIGADSYETLPTWRDPVEFSGNNYNGEKLMQEFEILCFPRQGWSLPNAISHKGKGYANLRVFQEEGFDLKLGSASSTLIREKVKQGRIEGLLPPKVAEYIKENKLYLN